MALQGATINALAVGLANFAAANDVANNVTTPNAITNSTSTAFTVGQAGATNPAFVVDASTASQVTGLKVKGAAAGGGVALSVVGGNAAEALTIDAKTSGAVIVGGTSTGLVSIGRGSVSVLIESSTKNTVSTAGALTISAAQMLAGFYLHTGTTGTQTTDTAANIDAAIPSVATGDSFTFFFLPTNTETLAGGNNVTIKGTSSIIGGKVAQVTVTRTAATPTYDAYVVLSA